MKDINSFEIIAGDVISNIIAAKLPEIYQLILQTYVDHYQHKISNQKSHFLRFKEYPDSRIIALPAYINNDDVRVSGIKWISSYPNNLKKGLRRASAVIILNDFETGYPLACLEGSLISATRTACSAVIAAKCMNQNEKKISTLGIVGTGFIAKNTLNIFQSQQWSIDKIILFDNETNNATIFKDEIKESFGNPIQILDSYERLIEQSQTILFTTTASKPYVNNLNLFTHKPNILNISLRDIAPEILIESNNIVDDIDSVLDANTSPHLAYQKYTTSSFINGTLGEMLEKNKQLDSKKSTIFSPMGLGILDLVLAWYIYEIALKYQQSKSINNFFNY